MDGIQDIVVRGTLLEACDLISIHLHEAALVRDVLEGLVIQEQWLNELEEAPSIKLQKPFQELWCRYKPHDVEDVHSPFERRERAIWELLAKKEQSNDPHQLVSYICRAMLNV